MKCLNCFVEIKSKGTKPAKYCSDKCRMQYKRTQLKYEQTNKSANEQIKPEQAKVEQPEQEHKGNGSGMQAAEIQVNFARPDLQPAQRPTGVLSKERQLSRHGFNE